MNDWALIEVNRLAVLENFNHAEKILYIIDILNLNAERASTCMVSLEQTLKNYSENWENFWNIYMSITLENRLKKSSSTTKSAQFHTDPKGANHQLCVTSEYMGLISGSKCIGGKLYWLLFISDCYLTIFVKLEKWINIYRLIPS